MVGDLAMERYDGTGGNRMKEEETFWMVYCDGGTAPTIKHNSHDGAFKEANRICSKEGKPVYVLKAVGGYKIIPNPNPVRFNIGELCNFPEKSKIGGIYTAPYDPNIRVTLE